MYSSWLTLAHGYFGLAAAVAQLRRHPAAPVRPGDQLPQDYGAACQRLACHRPLERGRPRRHRAAQGNIYCSDAHSPPCVQAHPPARAHAVAAMTARSKPCLFSYAVHVPPAQADEAVPADMVVLAVQSRGGSHAGAPPAELHASIPIYIHSRLHTRWRSPQTHA